jgi:hypothetical protein
MWVPVRVEKNESCHMAQALSGIWLPDGDDLFGIAMT